MDKMEAWLKELAKKKFSPEEEAEAEKFVTKLEEAGFFDLTNDTTE